jgi:hypothetical protein
MMVLLSVRAYEIHPAISFLILTMASFVTLRAFIATGCITDPKKVTVIGYLMLMMICLIPLILVCIILLAKD